MTDLAKSPFALTDPPTRNDLISKYFRGLGDPTRLRIMQLLRGAGELSAGEIVTQMGLPQATVSTHLGCLRWCGFVRTRREHRSVIYSVADARVGEVIALVEGLLDDQRGTRRVLPDDRSGGGGAMTVEVLYVEGCPNVERLLARIRDAMRSYGLGAELEARRVESESAAQAMRFLGSPTVRVNGRDVEPGAESRVDFGLGCRLYRIPGGVTGTPPEGWIDAALRRSATST